MPPVAAAKPRMVVTSDSHDISLQVTKIRAEGIIRARSRPRSLVIPRSAHLVFPCSRPRPAAEALQRTGTLDGEALEATYEYSMSAIVNGQGRAQESEADVMGRVSGKSRLRPARE